MIDDGPGIDPDQMARLVERSFRGDEARSRQPDGRGLGLHIVKGVVDLHGFELSLGTSEFGGLEVVIRAPLAG